MDEVDFGRGEREWLNGGIGRKVLDGRWQTGAAGSACMEPFRSSHSMKSIIANSTQLNGT